MPPTYLSLPVVPGPDYEQTFNTPTGDVSVRAATWISGATLMFKIKMVAGAVGVGELKRRYDQIAAQIASQGYRYLVIDAYAVRV